MILLDTHVVIWAWLGASALGPQARKRIESQPTIVSAISAQEIARLVANGKLTLSMSVARWLQAAQNGLGFQWHLVSPDDAIESYALPNFTHKDPCDRLLLATARNLGSSLLTADEVLLAYRHVDRVDARK